MPEPLLNGTYDVVIAGARCAGAATGMLLARRGLRVLIVDPVPGERDTLSTHALMRAGVLQLHRWGLLDAIRTAGTPGIRATVFHYDQEQIEIPIKAADGIDALYAPRRTLLDPVLAAGAVAAGADVAYGLSLTGLQRDRTGRVVGAVVEGPELGRREIPAALVIGADGLRSRVARLVGAPILHEATHATATIYGYWRDVSPGEYHWYFGRGGSVGCISTDGGATCIFTAMPPSVFEAARQDGLLALHQHVLRSVSPALAATLAGRVPLGRLRAFPGVNGFLRRSGGPGWALVGDASYFKDPLTAHGITDALRDAELLANAVLQGTDRALADYQRTRDELVTGFASVTDQIASLEWDIDEVKELHHSLSREMKKGLEMVRAFD